MSMCDQSFMQKLCKNFQIIQDDTDNIGIVGPSMQPEIDERKGPWNDNTDNMIQQQQTPGCQMITSGFNKSCKMITSD